MNLILESKLNSVNYSLYTFHLGPWLTMQAPSLFKSLSAEKEAPSLGEGLGVG